jgi:hypothetical protein
MTALADGLMLRPAQPDDLDQIGALLTARGDAADAEDHALVMADPNGGWESCAVVTDGARVVSTLTLLDEELRVGPCPVPTRCSRCRPDRWSWWRQIRSTKAAAWSGR